MPPKRPVEPPTLVAGAESLARVPTFQAEKEIERLLGLDTTAQPLFANETETRDKSGIPEEFKAELRRKYQRGELDGKVLDYYSDVLPRGDSTNVPGQGGRSVLLKSIMRQEDALPAALVAGPAWRPVRILGKGGFGEGTSIGKSNPCWLIPSHNSIMHYALLEDSCYLERCVVRCESKMCKIWRVDAYSISCCSDALGESSQEWTSE